MTAAVEAADLPLWRVTYAIPTEPTVIGVVRAATPRDAIEHIDRAEIALGRGPIIRKATDVERAWESGNA